MQGYPIKSDQIRDLNLSNFNELVTQHTESSAYVMLNMDVGGAYMDGVPVRQTLVRLQRLSDS